MTADADPPLAGGAEAADQPQRVHSLTIIVRLIRALPQFLLLWIALGVTERGGKVVTLVGLLVAVAIALTGLAALLRWWRFTYRLGRDEVRIEQGVINRKIRSIPYHRIQDVNVEQKPIPRLLGLAELKLETGSGGGDDGVLQYVSLTEAERLRALIKRLKAGEITPAGADAGADDAEVEEVAPIVFAMDLRRVLTAGLFNFSLVIFAVLATAVNQFDFLIPDLFWDPRYWFNVLHVDERVYELSRTMQIVGALIGMLLLVLVGLATGIIRTVLRDYGFRVERTDAGLRRRRGLLTLSDVAMPIHRVQAAVVQTGPIKSRFGWWVLKFQSLARDTGTETNHMLASLATRDEVEHLLAEPAIRWALDRNELEPVHPVLWRLPAAFFLTVAALAIGLGTVLVDPRLALALLLVPPLGYALRMGWAMHRYRLHEGQLYVHRGWWRRRLTILPLNKVQSVDVCDNIVYRRFGLASVKIGVAGGSGIVPLKVSAIPADDAHRLREELLRRNAA